jgi:hypothetical protein
VNSSAPRANLRWSGGFEVPSASWPFTNILRRSSLHRTEGARKRRQADGWVTGPATPLSGPRMGSLFSLCVMSFRSVLDARATAQRGSQVPSMKSSLRLLGSLVIVATWVTGIAAEPETSTRKVGRTRQMAPNHALEQPGGVAWKAAVSYSDCWALSSRLAHWRKSGDWSNS